MEKLKNLREQRVMSIGDLSDKSGVHRNTISRMENGRGKAYASTIRKLAVALGVEPSDLVRT